MSTLLLLVSWLHTQVMTRTTEARSVAQINMLDLPRPDGNVTTMRCGYGDDTPIKKCLSGPYLQQVRGVTDWFKDLSIRRYDTREGRGSKEVCRRDYFFVVGFVSDSKPFAVCHDETLISLT